MAHAPAHRLPKDALLALLPAAFGAWGASGAFRSRPPTRVSLERTSRELGVPIPPLLVEVAAACPSYGGWFGSIGDDFDSHNHILAINRSFRDEGMPPRYVKPNHGHDGDCDAWDTHAEPIAGELPIVYFSYHCERQELSRLRPSAASFADYVDQFVRGHARHCHVKSVRRRAKRILAEYPPAAPAKQSGPSGR